MASRLTSRFSRMTSAEGIEEGGDATKPDALGQVVVHMISASNLAAADKGGTSDPYAKVSLRVREKVIGEKGTKTVKKTLDPTWNAALRFNGVDDPDTEIVIIVKDWNPPSISNPKGEAKSLGQVSFRLMDHSLPADGEMLDIDLPLGEVTEGKVSKALKAQGAVKLRLGWFRGRGARHSTFSHAAAMVEEEEEEGVLVGGGGGDGAAGASAAGASASVAAAAPAATAPTTPLPPNAGDFEKPTSNGQMTLVLLQGNGLPAADKRGTSDPFAKITVNTGQLNLSAKSKVIKKTLDPVWNQAFPFESCKSEEVEITIQLRDDDGMLASSDPLGEVKFKLGELAELRRDGGWTALPPMELGIVAGQKLQVSGTLTLMIGWVEPPPPPEGGGVGEGGLMTPEALSAEYAPPGKAAQLGLVLLKAHGLVAADKRGTSDPYAKLLIRTGDKELKGKSKVIKKTLDPEWNEKFLFDGVLDDSVEVTIVLKDDDGMMSNGEPIGQADFVLRDVDVARDGTWKALPPIALHDVTESGVKQKYAAQGSLYVALAWLEPSDEEYAKLSGGGKKSEELEGVELDDEDSGGEGEEGGEEGAEEGEEDDQKSDEKRIEQELKAGDYQLQVHVIEAKDLAGRDASGLSDPCVFATCFGATRRSTTVEKAQSAVWDEQLFLEGREQTSDQLTTASVKIAVYDMDTMPFSKSDLIGEFTIDLLSIYYEPHHEIYRRWVALSAPFSARKPMIGEAAEGGVQGYLKLSLALLGPGDKPKVHDPNEEEPADSILMPPSLKMELNFLVVRVHRAEKLPAMDRSLFGGKAKGAGIDAYVKVNFAGYVAKTKVITSKSPRWLQEFWIPILTPSVGQFITIAVRDYDKMDAHDDVDILTIPFDHVKQGKVTRHGWWHLYGLSEAAERAASASFMKAAAGGGASRRRELKKNRAFYSSVWRGKVLLSLHVHKNDEKKPLPEKLLKQPIGTPRPEDPSRVAYELCAAVMLGSDVDNAPGLEGSVDEVSVEIAVEEFEFRTKPARVLNGVANFMADPAKPKNGYPGVLVKTTGAERPFMLPEDTSQVADVVVYLCRRAGKSGGGAWERIAYHRFTAAEAMVYGYGVTRRWLRLRPVTSAKPVVGKPLPALLLQVALRKAAPPDALPAQVWPPPADAADALPTRSILTAYEARLHIYQARDLPATDDDGVSDAYVVAKLAGKSEQSSVQYDTTHPQWYETLVLRVWLPDLNVAPDLVVSVWDRDDGIADPDDFIGVCRLPVKHALLAEDAPLPEPTWVPLEARGVSGGGGGELLLLLELLPLPSSSVSQKLKPVEGGVARLAQIKDSGDGGMPSLAIPDLSPHPKEINSLVPERKKASLKLAVLGITGLRQASRTESKVSVMGIKKPYVQADIGKRTKGKNKKGGGGGGGSAMAKTTTSSKPSSYSPLYLEVLELKPMLPSNPLLLPPLNFCVHDSLFGGLRTPLLGSAVVLLQDRIPAGFFSTPKLGTPTGVQVAETWENERWHMLQNRGWQPARAASGSDEPPHFSNARPPFHALPKDEFKLVGDWEWETEWQVDTSANPSGDGWVYAAEFAINGRLSTFASNDDEATRMSRTSVTLSDLYSTLVAASQLRYVRRRKWVRTRRLRVSPEEKTAELMLTAKSVKEIAEHENERRASRSASRMSVSSRRLSVAALQRLSHDSAPPELSSLSAALSSKGAADALGARAQSARVASARCGAPMLSQSGRVGSGRHTMRTTAFPAGPSERSGRVDGAGGEMTPAADDYDVEAAAAPGAAHDERPGAPLLGAQQDSAARVAHLKEAAAAGQTAGRESLAAAGGDIEMGDLAAAAEAAAGAGADADAAGPMTEEAYIETIESLEAQVVYKRQQRKRVEKDMEAPEAKKDDVARLKEKLARVSTELVEMEDDLARLKEEFDAEHNPSGGDTIVPKYMKGRVTVEEELENTIDDIPFERFTLMSGQGRKRTAVGTLKALVKAGENDLEWDETEAATIEKLRTPGEYVVRVYILRGDNLMSLDATGASDPYLRVTLGSQKQDNRSEHLNDVTTAHFCRMFELQAQLPGVALLRIECWDYDGFGRRSDDLIGATEVDLEDRVFSQHWQGLSERTPVERRSIYSSMSKRPQGSLDLWVDIMTPEQAEKNPPIDISPPPEQKFELRVICWSAKDVPSEARDDSGLVDLYSSVRFGKGKFSSTDTHFRAQNGKASWNWRFILPITMDSFVSNEVLKLTVQMWDKDLLSSNDCIGEETISLARWLKQIYTRRALSKTSKSKGAVYWFSKDNWDPKGGPAQRPKTQEEESAGGIPGWAKVRELLTSIVESQPLLSGEEDPDLEAAKFWLPVRARGKQNHQGKLLMSIQLVPVEEVEKLPAGRGRNEPNTNPELPKPVGRLSFTLNPFKMLFRLIGPKYFSKLMKTICCLLCCVIMVLMIYYMFPVVFANLMTGNVG